MKILKIALHNLASLQGTWTVDLEAEPLASAATFAITGPKGAGKSTLLDAVCLALYGCTPRLGGGGHVVEGNGDVRSRDARSIVRRGRGEGWAEVVFLGRDGRCYRACWSARRARGKANGRFQNVQVALFDGATDTPLTGSTKSETLALIEDKVGLSYDQFTRAAMLAQGRFAAFLEADSDTRAKLLEQITGGELYTRISRAAHAAAREVRQSVEELERRLLDHAPLSAEARLEAEEAVAAAEVEALTASTRLEEAKAAVAWHAALRVLTTEVETARATATSVEAAWTAARSGEARLTQVEGAQDHRIVLATADGLDRRVAELQDELTGATTAAEGARTVAEDAERALSQAQEDLTAARQRLAVAQPELRQAAALDGEVRAAEEARCRAKHDAEQAAGLARSAELAAAAALAKLEAARRAQGQLETWCQEHRDDAALTEGWALWDQLLGTYAEAGQAKDELHRRLAEVEERHRRESAALGCEARALEQARAAEGEAQEHLAQCQLALQGVDLAGLQADRSEAQNRLRALEGLQAIAEDARGLQAQLDELGASLIGAQTSLGQAQEMTRRASVEAEAATQTEVTLVVQLERARAQRGVAAYRSQLVDGEPCMLCGATEHPYAHEVPLVDDLLAGLQQARDEARERFQAARNEQATAQSEVARREEQLREGGRARDVLQRKLTERAQAWSEGCAALDLQLAAAPETAEADAATAAHVAESKAQLEAVQLAEQRAHGALAQERLARDGRDAALAGAHRCDGGVQQAEKRLSATSNELAGLTKDMAQAAAGQQGARERLEPVLEVEPSWRARLDRDPLGLRSEVAARVNAWRCSTQELEAAGKRLAALQQEQSGLTATAQERAHQAKDALSAMGRAVERDEALRAQRAGLFDGRATIVVEQELQGAVEGAEAQRDQAQLRAGRASEASATAAQAHERVERELRTATLQHNAAQQALRASLKLLGVSLPELRDLLVHDATWIRAERTRLGELRQAVDQAEAVLREREERRRAHDAKGRPTLDAEQAGLARDEAGRADESARKELEAKRFVLRHDDGQRTKAGLVQADLDQARLEGGAWLELAKAIGSEDGKALRVFVQSLTFQILLEQANVHLAQLDRRYQLEAVPGDALDLQLIDLDLAEVRPDSNLSGGESFLVSLALALGLASLSSRQTQVETLFIDEGFGTLDPVSLETVVNALDALQSDGRQVGVISHVPALAERLGAEIRVTEQGGGRSRIEVVGATADPLALVDEVLATGNVRGQQRSRGPQARSRQEVSS